MVAACGGGGGSSPDAAAVDAGLPNEGFVPPDHIVMGNMGDTEVDADFTCLNTASTDVATTVDINLGGHLTDFQTGNTVTKPTMATIEAFQGIDYTNVVDTAGPNLDLDATYALTLPAGGTRWGFKITDPDYLDTFLLNQYYVDAVPAPMQDIAAISSGTAAALPALIGLQRAPQSGVLAGAFRDCADHEVSYAVATVTTNSCVGNASCDPMQLPGAVTYYIDAGAGIPVHHEQLNHTDINGLFAVLQLPATTTAYVQIWGFLDAADLADGQMTLLSELQAPVLADTVITGSFQAVRN